MGKIKVTQCGDIEGLKVIEPTVFGDSRGYFMETYNYNDFKEAGIDVEFVQDNQSSSRYGVLRGLHFQISYPQDKLVRVVNGEVFDVAVDLREGSKTFGKWYGVVLSAENKKQFFIPKGFAHGFLVLSENAEFTYKCSDFYHPNDEGGLSGRSRKAWSLFSPTRTRSGEASRNIRIDKELQNEENISFAGGAVPESKAGFKPCKK